MGEDWKSKLISLRGSVPEGTPKVTDGRKQTSKEDSAVVPDKDKQTDTVSEHQRQIEQEQAEIKNIEENDPDFLKVVQILKLRKGEERYHRILRNVFYASRRGDVSYHLQRWVECDLEGLFLREKVNRDDQNKLKSIINKIKKRGYRATAYDWWQSATPEGMRNGKGTKELRLEQADKFAKLAGIQLEDIVSSKGK